MTSCTQDTARAEAGSMNGPGSYPARDVIGQRGPASGNGTADRRGVLAGSHPGDASQNSAAVRLRPGSFTAPGDGAAVEFPRTNAADAWNAWGIARGATTEWPDDIAARAAIGISPQESRGGSVARGGEGSERGSALSSLALTGERAGASPRSVDAVGAVGLGSSRDGAEKIAHGRYAAGVTRCSSPNFTGAAVALARTLAASVLFVGMACAEPPPGSDPNSPVAKWVQTLTDHAGRLCCGLNDCRPTIAHVSPNGGVWVWIGKAEFGPNAPDAFLPVDEDVVMNTHSRGPSPDGRTWACFYQGRVNCFLPGGAS